jgi:hypothetical protein
MHVDCVVCAANLNFPWREWTVVYLLGSPLDSLNTHQKIPETSTALLQDSSTRYVEHGCLPVYSGLLSPGIENNM